jgi:hypothetical protein
MDRGLLSQNKCQDESTYRPLSPPFIL